MICLENLHHSYGSLKVIEDLSFDLPRESITCLLGPSGCGKTTLLHIIAGTLALQEGRIGGLPLGGVSYLFQEPRLLPWKTLSKNLDLVLKKSYTPEQRRAIIKETLSLVELDSFSGYYPHQLSGGMRQRGALARAFAFPAELLLMDEPFQALDPALKLDLMEDFRRLWERDRRTTLLVTHNIQEATLLGDHILVLSKPPARLITAMENPVVPGDRLPFSEGVLALERRLYLTLLEGRREEDQPCIFP
jgi:NitT/TauT family transport system ATP-binding protein